ncbi:MAG: phosphate signaling complex protein PhoU [Verrucomicrobiota bacterium]
MTEFIQLLQHQNYPPLISPNRADFVSFFLLSSYLGLFLGSSVLTMASIAQRNLETIYRGLMERDSELCRTVIGEDDEVDELEMRVDQEGMEVIMRFAPVAQDLRRTLGSMRIAANLERISDQAVNIARRTRKMNKQPEVAQAKVMDPAFRLALSLVEDSIRAYSEGDVSLAREVIKRDAELDDVHDKLIKEFTTAMEVDRDNLRTYLHLLFVVRFLERVGDHAENISEDVIFIELGTDVRHKSLDSLS